ncbi:hypothetical protein RS75_21110 [Rhizobium nepotum 39/7]|uniref:Uncharacterized protein n=1 Tax=Rhizobium nepotum 39/7 TaxID=1368418 RepID=A0ABR5CLP5_9HYPH|nr:hypothetical protein RS75_21110 [Rhizobium nepotum 39/7]
MRIAIDINNVFVLGRNVFIQDQTAKSCSGYVVFLEINIVGKGKLRIAQAKYAEFRKLLSDDLHSVGIDINQVYKNIAKIIRSILLQLRS